MNDIRGLLAEFVAARRKQKGGKPVSGPHHCETPGCGRPTAHGKPHCAKHLLDLPYVRDLVERMAARDAEVRKIARRGVKAVTSRTTLLEDVVRELALFGERTMPRLRIETGLPEEVVEALVEYLRRRGIVARGCGRRGEAVARLAPKACAGVA